jgi:hypothetical protein
MLGDLAVDVGMERVQHPVQLAVLGGGQPQRRGQHGPHAAVELPYCHREGLARGLGINPRIGAEQDLAHDASGQIPQRGHQFDGLAARGEGPPARQHGRRGRGNHVRPREQPLPLEQRLH